MEEPSKREPMKWTDIAIVILTAGILAAAGLQTYIFHRQRQEMTGAGEQTDRIIEADKRLAAANERFAAAMETSNTNSKEALDKTIKENKKTLASSLAQAQKTLNATIAASRNDQRAWIAISEINPPKLQADQPFLVAVEFKNTGRTPAKNFLISGAAEFVPTGGALNRPETSIPGNGLILPQGSFNTVFGSPDTKFQQPFIDQIIKKDLFLYIHGRLTYDDVFGKSHWTKILLHS